jgi:phenol 2-monooxygenase
VDVLIIGSGPTGLTLAAQLAAFPEIRTRIIDQKDGPLLLGQADGIACRTVEMFEAFGFAERVLKEAYWVNETTFWEPDENRRSDIVRSRRIQDTEDGLSEFPHVILNQARVHDFFLQVMRNSPTRLKPDYSRRLVDLRIESEENAGSSRYPVAVRVERIDPAHAGQFETVNARFVVGCDGARSAVRQSLGYKLSGESASRAWGVMDVLAVTDFPDIRLKTIIHSVQGNALIIPREGGYLVRLYIELDKLHEDVRVARELVTSDHIVQAAQRILHPYSLDVKEIAWWSVYEIGQRLTEKFDDVPGGEGQSRFPHVFIAGDACHTHSPKAGQGMNVSMQDALNLGWKLASVLLGRCSPAILHTYSTERRSVAQELLDFDRKLAKMFSTPKAFNKEADGVDTAEFQQYFVQQGRFTAGVATRYDISLISGEPTYQRLAQGFTIGMRFHSAPVVRLADAKPVHLGHAVKADGRWRLFAFAAEEDPLGSSSRIRQLCDFLEHSPESPVRRYAPRGADIDAVIDVRAVFQQPHRELEVAAMPSLLLPQKGRYGLRDYEKMFCPDFQAGSDIFDMRGIDRSSGCMVIVRPDQHVAHILPLTAYAELATFFAGFMQDPE